MSTAQSVFPLQRYFPKASALVYGCMGLGGGFESGQRSGPAVDQALAAVDAALDAGINVFDHADIYQGGAAEGVFKAVFQARPGLRDKIILQSKCGIRLGDESGPKRYDFSKSWILNSVENSLARLGAEHLDVLLLHRPDPLMEPEEIAEAFFQLQAAGKVRFFGVSNMHRYQMEFLHNHVGVPLVANQIEVSLAQRAWLEEGVLVGQAQSAGVGFTSGTLEWCREQGVQIQSWGSLCQGRYSGVSIDDGDLSTAAVSAEVAAQAEAHGCSAEAIVLAWLMRHPTRIQPVIGTTNPERIRACGPAADIQLSRGEWYTLYELARGNPMP